MKGKRSSIFLIGMLAIGICLLLYPTVSDYWNSFHQTRVISSYTETVASLDDVSYESYLDEAESYNETLVNKKNRYTPSDSDHETYESLLNISGNGVMGYIDIPSIDVTLTIYHGTEDSVLQVGVGHVEGSSLPVGGESTHCVLSGHRGLTSARLFTDLDELTEGDTFTLHILDEVLTYEVDQIRIVEPEELDDLEIESGEDLCTLVTCTPYGINTHRLLVRGHRIETSEEVRVTADAVQIDTVFVAPAIAAPILAVLLIYMLISGHKKKGKRT